MPPWKTFKESVKGLPEPSDGFYPIPQNKLEFYSLLKPGNNWKNLPVGLQKKAMKNAFFSEGGKTGFFRRLSWDQPAPTLLTSPLMKATSLVHPEEPRSLSIYEYKRLQCFPDDWKLCGSVRDWFRQIGNAVPVKLAEAVGKAIMGHKAGKKIDKRFAGFKYSRYNNTSDETWR